MGYGYLWCDYFVKTYDKIELNSLLIFVNLRRNNRQVSPYGQTYVVLSPFIR
jgi:hypothetical protein